MDLVKTIAFKFDRVCYLSSMDIERDFIKKCDLTTDGGHSKMTIL